MSKRTALEVLDELIKECDDAMNGNPPFKTWPNPSLDFGTLRNRLIDARNSVSVDEHFEHMARAIEALESIGPSVTHDSHGDRKRLNLGVALALQFLRLTAGTEQPVEPAAAEAVSHASELAGYMLTDDMEVQGVRVRSYRKLE